LKIIHTSDWHLGQSFINQSRKHEHSAFLAWLITQVQSLEVDAVIVAGDIFDTTTPPSYAREMYHQFVTQLHAVNCTLVLLGGNHDSVAMLNESLPLLRALGTHMIPNSLATPAQQVVPLTNRQTGDIEAIVCAIPFLRPRDLVVAQSGEDDLSKQARFKAAITEHYANVYQAAIDKRTALGLTIPIIATGHLTAVGTQSSESERSIYVGTLENYPKEAFPPADYTALGHIHRPQVVSNSRHIYYSGSPIALSFDELSIDKRVMLVEFANTPDTNSTHVKATHPNKEPKFTPTLTSITIPRFQPMQELEGNIDEIKAQLARFPLTSEAGEALPTWLLIKLTDANSIHNIANTIAEFAHDKHVVITKIMRIRTPQEQALRAQHHEVLTQLEPTDVFSKRLESETELSDSQHTQLNATFHDIVTKVTTGIPLDDAAVSEELIS
jgi:exonuclease SbcD